MLPLPALENTVERACFQAPACILRGNHYTKHIFVNKAIRGYVYSKGGWQVETPLFKQNNPQRPTRTNQQKYNKN